MSLPLERDAIQRALRDANGNIGKAAVALGASRRTLQNRMREYGLARGKAGRRKRILPYGRKHRYVLPVAAGLGALALGAVALMKKGTST